MRYGVIPGEGFMIQAAVLAMLLDEASVRSIHAALDAKTVTCAQVIRHYLDRIAAYDDRGPAVNAIITVNPRAIETAEQMDRIDRTTRQGRPLHCIPVVLKDNFHTADMPTTGGSVTFEKMQTPDDGFVVKRLRDAGAIVVAKANLHELARAGTSVSSLGGQTKNPYEFNAHPRRIQRRHRRGDRRELRRARHRQRHRPVDPLAVIRERAGRVAGDARAGEPRRHDAVQHHARRRRPDRQDR